MALHCSPPPNVLQHGVAVTGEGITFILALIDAVFKLIVDVAFAEGALRRDAAKVKCPKKCPVKSVGKAMVVRGITFAAGFNAGKKRWHVTIGVACELDVMCEPREGGVEA